MGLLGRLIDWAIPGGRIDSRGLLGTQELQRSLRREQARTDRGADPFALLVLAPPRGANVAETMQCVAEAVRKRIRVTDEAGWLDHAAIGILLPSTPAQGAWTLADDICLSLPLDVELPVCRVYVYPPPRTPRANGEHAAEDRQAGGSPVGTLDNLLAVGLPLWKRGLDVIVSSLALLLLAPLLAVVALAVKLTSPGPVFFRQLRSGLGGRPFVCLKFRTMVVDAENRKADLMARNEQDGPAFKIRNDPRITRLGKFLRQTSIDELPQLWNVLCGEMTLVGPRPLPVAEAEACRGWLRRRQDVTPGLTCIWQVHGRSKVSFIEWVRMDLRYSRSRSLWHDLKLIVQTVPAMLVRRNGC